jgi:hypothetical protein
MLSILRSLPIVSDRLQNQRFELKYHLSEAHAFQLRQFVQGNLPLDPYGVGQPNLSYPTLSLYLDTDDLDTYWHTVAGHKNRFKLRLRYYDDRPETPVFFEVKHRVKDVILKKRGGVRKGAVRGLLAGHLPQRDHLLDPNDAQALAAVQDFCQSMLRMRARPKMHVAYLREAYEDPDDNSVRVTFDRRVESQPNSTPQLIERSPKPHLVFGRTAILELKFLERYPRWFHELVTQFNCVQEGAAKYAEGIYEKGEEWVHRACSPERVMDEFLSGETYPRLFDPACCLGGYRPRA